MICEKIMSKILKNYLPSFTIIYLTVWSYSQSQFDLKGGASGPWTTCFVHKLSRPPGISREVHPDVTGDDGTLLRKVPKDSPDNRCAIYMLCYCVSGTPRTQDAKDEVEG